MSPKGRSIGDTRGAILIATVITLAFLSVLGLSLLAFLYSRMVYSQVQIDRLKAMYLAEAGLARQIHELRYGIDPDGDGVGNIPNTRLGDGEYWARHDFQTSLMTAGGVVNGARRKIQIKYSAI